MYVYILISVGVLLQSEYLSEILQHNQVQYYLYTCRGSFYERKNILCFYDLLCKWLYLPDLSLLDKNTFLIKKNKSIPSQLVYKFKLSDL